MQYYYSHNSVKIGQNLIRKYGIYAAIRYGKNLGLTLNESVEYFAMIERV